MPKGKPKNPPVINEVDTEQSVATKVKPYCLKCGDMNPKDFYSTKDPDRGFSGKIPYCKSCIKEIYHRYLLKYNDDRNLAIYYLCRKIDLPYIHSVYLGAVKTTESEFANYKDEDAIISAYVKGLALVGAYTFDESKGEREIPGLSAFDEITKVKREVAKANLNSNAMGDEYEIIEYDTSYLQNKWGVFDNEDLAYLENQYLDWEDKLGGIDDKSLDMLIQQICLQALEIRKTRELGGDVTKMVKTLRELMNDGGLVEKQNKRAELTNRSVGQRIEDIERMRPVFAPDADLIDVDNIEKIVVGFVGSTSRALGKNNAYTEKFDELYGPYTIDIIDKYRNDVVEEEKEPEIPEENLEALGEIPDV